MGVEAKELRRFLFGWTEDGCHATTFHLWLLIDLCKVNQLLDKARKHFHAVVLIDDIPTAELDIGFNFMAGLQESFSMLGLEIEIMRVCMWTKADFLQFNSMLLLTGFLLFLLLFVPKLAKIHDFANRWLSIRRDFNQVQFLFFGHFDGHFRWVNTVISLGVYNPHL